MHYAFGSWEWFDILAGQTALVQNYSLLMTEFGLDPIRGVAGLGGVWWKRFQNVFVQYYYWVGLEVDIVE